MQLKQTLLDQPVIIIGAGIAGNTMAISLKRQGYQNILVIEKDNDPTLTTSGRGKSINLAASDRSLVYFKECEINVPKMVKMRARLIHTAKGSIMQTYDQFGRYLLSVNRNDLNRDLCLEAKKYGVRYYFNHKLSSIDFASRSIIVCNDKNVHTTYPYDFLIGADGSNSFVADQLDHHNNDNYQPVTDSEWVYQEYEVAANNDSQFAIAMAKNFHIWPGKERFLIALPNADKTFTVTLFCRGETASRLCKMPKNGQGIAEITHLFKEMCAETPLELFNIEENFINNKVSRIHSRDSKHWYENFSEPRVLLIGDAAHAFPPFLGLGFNAAVEDVAIFMALLQQQPDLSYCIRTFANKRRIDTNALRDASIENAYTLSSEVAEPDKSLKFILTEHLERVGRDLFIEPHTLYSFTHLPESEARYRQLYQQDLITELLKVDGLREAIPDDSLENMAIKLEELLHKPNVLSVKIVELLTQYQHSLGEWQNDNRTNILQSPFYQYKGSFFFSTSPQHVVADNISGHCVSLDMVKREYE